MTPTRFDGSLEPIAISTRSDFDESIHHGAGVALDADGAVIASIGNPELVVYPRSSLKPLQADAMVSLGLDLSPELLAVACASHNGESQHLDAVRRILELHGLGEADLANTPTRPSGAAARAAARRRGVAPSSIQQNCSGKHAAMLATCVVNGWTRHDYLDMGHPLQVAITQHVDSLIGTRVTHVGVDGCGAPTHAFSLRGLAVAYSTLARRGSAVATAMNAHPDLVGGTGRDISTWMAAVPGLMAKEGAAAVMAAALPDGRAVAFKIGDGSPDCRQAVTIEAMRQLLPSTDPAIWNSIVSSVSVPVLGHGSPVGMLRALAWQ